ncbi:MULTISPECIES: ABC transporter permease [Thermomonospora]|uniref:Transport permease protein n=1 Tax=Thermomonospora cellulosilytica TaxID=1411118 RepID=A0A7W3N107_9ACTN|nr:MULTISPECIES: ABC transporter permease [Thermomonospora]MBA9005525.1 ABC transporter DrrB family efflux protein [Thermomonospora cellulosilytica]
MTSSVTAAAWTVHDIWVVMLRHLLHLRRVPQLLFFSAVQPVVFLLLFASVFGGAIAVSGLAYEAFMVPGMFAQTMAFAGAATSVGLADDLRGGFIDRYRSLPMSHSAVLAGRMIADGVRNLSVIIALAAAGHLMGFRFTTGPLEVLAGLAILLAFSFAISCVGAVIGLTARSPEAAQMAASIWMMPVVFMSSAFVPLDKLPGWLRVWADHSPVTATVDSMRALFFGYGDTSGPVLMALAWFAVLVGVCLPLAVRLFHRTASK